LVFNERNVFAKDMNCSYRDKFEHIRGQVGCSYFLELSGLGQLFTSNKLNNKKKKKKTLSRETGKE
jgi:hypothetical protein